VVRLSAGRLSAATAAILEGVGTPPAIARRVAEVLVNANLAGHDSHGVIRLPGYLEQVERGAIAVAAEPEVVRTHGVVAVMDGRRGWGHWAMDRAMTWAVQKAREAGLGAVALFRTNHAGRMGEYVEAAARGGCASIVLAGAGGREVGCSAPLGGRGRFLGPNPVAVGAPAGEGPPFVLDFATTVVAQGKVKVAQSRGETVPAGWIVDAQGRPSVRPEDLFAGGSLVHFGGHKGYALSLMTCVIGGLSGGFQADRAGLGGIFVEAMDVSAFLPLTTYQERVRCFLDGIKAAPLAPDAREILVPGEPEWRARQERLGSGVEIPAGVWAEIRAVAARAGVAVPEAGDGDAR
jgi:LDH2 family malate/lactate/ureidoglycolate dehydrogenase